MIYCFTHTKNIFFWPTPNRIICACDNQYHFQVLIKQTHHFVIMSISSNTRTYVLMFIKPLHMPHKQTHLMNAKRYNNNTLSNYARKMHTYVVLFYDMGFCNQIRKTLILFRYSVLLYSYIPIYNWLYRFLHSLDPFLPVYIYIFICICVFVNSIIYLNLFGAYCYFLFHLLPHENIYWISYM